MPQRYRLACIDMSIRYVDPLAPVPQCMGLCVCWVLAFISVSYLLKNRAIYRYEIASACYASVVGHGASLGGVSLNIVGEASVRHASLRVAGSIPPTLR